MAPLEKPVTKTRSASSSAISARMNPTSSTPWSWAYAQQLPAFQVRRSVRPDPSGYTARKPSRSASASKPVCSAIWAPLPPPPCSTITAVPPEPCVR